MLPLPGPMAASGQARCFQGLLLSREWAWGFLRRRACVIFISCTEPAAVLRSSVVYS